MSYELECATNQYDVDVAYICEHSLFSCSQYGHGSTSIIVNNYLAVLFYFKIVSGKLN